METFHREMECVKKNHMDILELKTLISEVNNIGQATQGLNTGEYRISELEQRLIETTQISIERKKRINEKGWMAAVTPLYSLIVQALTCITLFFKDLCSALLPNGESLETQCPHFGPCAYCTGW